MNELEVRDKEIARLKMFLMEKEARIESLASELRAIRTSPGWPLLCLCRSLKNRWFPENSLQLYVLNLVIKVNLLFLKTMCAVISQLKVASSGYRGVNTIMRTKNKTRLPAWNRVLMISGTTGGATERYRCYHAQEQLRLQGIRCEVQHVTSRGVFDVVRDHDIIILHRVCCCKDAEEIIRIARTREAYVLFDTDDLVFDPEILEDIGAIRTYNAAQRASVRDTVRLLRSTLKLCDGALVTTEHLVREVAKIGRPAWVHRNALSVELIRLSDKARAKRKRKDGRLIIGYASGTKTHDLDFKEAENALLEVIHAYDQVQLWIIGHLDLDEKWARWAHRVRRIPFVPWRDLPALLAQFDINLAPLERNSPYTEAKSEIKYVEAAAVGVPTIASDTGAFKFAIRHGDNGLLAMHSDQWFEALKQLVTDAALRAELGSSAYADAMQRYHPNERSAALVVTLDKIVEWLDDQRRIESNSLGPGTSIASTGQAQIVS